MAVSLLRLRRRALGLLWSSLGVLLLAYLFLVAMLIIYRHPLRLDFTETEENTLSAETRNRLGLLNEGVRVVFPVALQDENPLHAIQGLILHRARKLLDEYLALQPLLAVEAELDLRLPADAERWKLLCQRHGLSPGQFNCFIFLAGEGEEALRQVVTPDDLAAYDRPKGSHDPEPPQVREFRAERAFTAALTRLIQREKRRIYALEDHREAPAADAGPQGLGALKRELETLGYEVLPLSFAARAQVPEDCELLLIAAPAAPFPIEHRERVNDYLRKGGRLLAAAGPVETGIADLLDPWGIKLATGRAYRRQVLGTVAVFRPDFFAEELNPEHPVTAPLRGLAGAGSLAWFSDARAVGTRAVEGLQGDYLLRTADDPKGLFVDRNQNGKRDPGEEERQVVLGAAVWRPLPPRPPPDYRHLDTRLVVLGDAAPLTNLWFPQYAHRDLVLNAVNWLLGREERLTVGSTAWQERRLRWDARIQGFLFWVPVFLFPGVVIGLGGFIYYLRRS